MSATLGVVTSVCVCVCVCVWEGGGAHIPFLHFTPVCLSSFTDLSRMVILSLAPAVN